MFPLFYDTALGRFLSPDPYVQMPDFTQNFNRYSYCLNNPLVYIDQDGELVWFIPVIIGAVIGGTSGTMLAGAAAGAVGGAGFNGLATNRNGNAMFQGALFGGISGFVGGGFASAIGVGNYHSPGDLNLSGFSLVVGRTSSSYCNHGAANYTPIQSDPFLRFFLFNSLNLKR